jgi:hypothetical protein
MEQAEHTQMEKQEEKEITIGGKSYAHVKTREYTPVSIFKGDGDFLRIGTKDLLVPELNLHKKLLDYGFPVPAITAEGTRGEYFYYTEASLGDELLGKVFWEDSKREGQISSEHFGNLLKLSEQFAQAQLKTATEHRDDESFYIGIHMDFILEELPELKTGLLAAFEKIKERTKALPYVLTHGDFNAYNLFEGGVIDLGSTHTAPAGYDIISNIYHTYGFPKTGDYESMRRYEFTEPQINEYLAAMDSAYSAAGLPKVSNFKEDFILARAVWGTTRMQRYPKLQQWRYNRFKQMLSEYLSDKSIIHTTLDFNRTEAQDDGRLR